MTSRASGFPNEEPYMEVRQMPNVRPAIVGDDPETAHGAPVEEGPGYAWELAQAFNETSKQDADFGIFHPVLLFGTAQSGKSLALASILSYALENKNSKIAHTLIDFNYPRSHPAHQTAKNWAKEFYYKDVANFQKDPSAKAEPTRRGHPFFVPIRAVFGSNDDKPEVARFAFLESVGEWIHRKADGYTFDELKPDIVEILKNYSNPISVIFVAPSTHDNLLNDDAVKESHQCIAHCMNRYVELRKRNYGDNLLLLLSRWDAKYRPDAADTSDEVDNFAHATSSTVIDALGSYPWAWMTFSNLPFVSRGSRALVQYAPTWIIDGVRTNEGRFRPVFNQFNRTTWNWLYGNVFVENNERSRGGRGERKNLYTDVSLSNRGRGVGLYDAAMRRAIALVKA
jgi:hypothetical protein